MVRGEPYPVDTLPSAMDVVWGRFPLDEDPRSPGSPHPCLVFGAGVHTPTGVGFVKVVFGSSNTRRTPREPNFTVSNYNALRVAGLHKVTLFDLGKSRVLWWTDAWFVTPDPKRWSTPKIGCIEQLGKDVLREILSQRRQLGYDCP